MTAKVHSSDSDFFDYAIIGGGCFGVPAALALQQKFPAARIILYEGVHQYTASRDTSKIVRAAYEDEDYVALAQRALKIWATDILYKEFYHHAGWIQVIGQEDHANTVKGPQDTMISIEDMQKMVGFLEAPKLADGEDLRLNKDIGYVDIDLAIEAIAVQASKLGVKREKKTVSKLLLEDGLCTGIRTDDNKHITAGVTLVATGPWTPELLDHSQVPFPEDFFTVAGVPVATLPLTDAEFERLQGMPILVTEGGEVILSRRQRSLKITTTRTFRIANADEPTKLNSIDIQPNRDVLEKMLPEFTGRPLESWVCPDVLTPFQHPLLDQIPGVQRLYIATGGSYHSAKFAPIIGSMVVRRLREPSQPDHVADRLLQRWGWERSRENVAVHSSVVPCDED